MSEIQQGRYDQLLRRVADLKGPGSKVNDALTELFPVIDVERVPGELLFLMGTKVAYGGQLLNQEVGSTPKIQIFNPEDSQYLLTVTKAIFSTSVTDLLIWDISSIPETSRANTERVLDTRQGVDEIPIGQIRFTLDAAAGAVTGSVRRLANTPYTLENENGIAILAPGSGLTVATTAQNLQFTATFYWRERLAEPSEFNF